MGERFLHFQLNRKQKCERLQIWKEVLTSIAFAKKTSAILKYETGRDEYDSIYLERLTPTLQRYKLDRMAALLIFEEEGGWPYPPNYSD